jgi:glycosyltransferase involved in cell wall biosynthesis
MRPKICLTMIVKNEEHVIERALRSAIPFIDSYAICDTGSTDSTKEIIKRIMDESGKSGVIKDDVWVNFGHNRTLALEAAQEQEPEGWSWMLDADDSMDGQPLSDDFWEKLDPKINAFRVLLKHGSIVHNRVQLFSNKAKWGYEGAIHEWPKCKEGDEVIGMLPDTIWQIARCEGARSQDPLKYYKDALALRAELVQKPNDPRSLFYMAQSFRDAGLNNEAIVSYKKRIAVEGWVQERYISYVSLIKLTDDLDEKIEYCWKALELDNTRLEAPYYVLHAARKADKFSQKVYALGIVVTNRTLSQSYLFPEQGIYDWCYDDELSIIAYWTRQYKTCYVSAARSIMRAPEQHQPRIQANINFAKEKLGLK